MSVPTIDRPPGLGRPPAAAPAPSRPAGRGRAWLLEAGAVLALIAVAACLRWPDYLYIPVFTDEAWDTSRSALIAQGRLQTPVNVSSYIGSLQNYLTVGLWSLFGPQIYLPRLLFLVLGALTVGAAYLLGREWGGAWAGALAATLVAASPVHILVNSHLGWSNSMTPLFSTLALWQLSVAVRQRWGGPLIAAGALFGLAMQSHPATVMLLPAGLLFVLWKAPGLLKRPAPWLAAGLFLLIMSPIAIYNLTSGFHSVQYAEQVRTSHADGRDLGPDLYLDNLDGVVTLLLRTLSGLIEARPSPWEFLADPALLLWLGLASAVPLYLARQGQPLPLLLLIATVLLTPLWSLNRWEPISNGRYIMPTVVALFAAVGAAGARLAGGRSPAGRPDRFRLALVGLVGLVLIVRPLFELGRYYQSRPADNRSTIEAFDAIEANRGPDEVVLLDRKLRDRRLGEGAVQLDYALKALLDVRAIPTSYVDVEPEALDPLLAQRPSLLLVLDRSNLERLTDRYRLTRLATIGPRVSRAVRGRDAVPAWRDLPLGALLETLDPRGQPERRDAQRCPDCDDHGVFRVAR